VKGFAFEGNTVFSDDELAAVTASFTNRDLTSAEIEDARRVVTVHYINAGYVNSGAVIPNQEPVDGIILLRIIEGQLTEINLEGNRWLRHAFAALRERLEHCELAGPVARVRSSFVGGIKHVPMRWRIAETGGVRAAGA
jgi:hemolysin activation/secretion protein